MVDFLNHLSCWDWFSFAVAVFIVDLMLATGILLWIAIAAFLLGLVIAVAPAIGWEVQLFLLGILSVVNGIVGKQALKRLPRRNAEQTLNAPESKLIGRTFEVFEEIKNGHGRVRAGDGVWPASGPDVQAGEMVRVTRVEAMKLIVEPVQAHK